MVDFFNQKQRCDPGCPYGTNDFKIKAEQTHHEANVPRTEQNLDKLGWFNLPSSFKFEWNKFYRTRIQTNRVKQCACHGFAPRLPRLTAPPNPPIIIPNFDRYEQPSRGFHTYGRGERDTTSFEHKERGLNTHGRDGETYRVTRGERDQYRNRDRDYSSHVNYVIRIVTMIDIMKENEITNEKNVMTMVAMIDMTKEYVVEKENEITNVMKIITVIDITNEIISVENVIMIVTMITKNWIILVIPSRVKIAIMITVAPGKGMKPKRMII